MPNAPLQLRYERKFVPDDLTVAEVRACVQRQSAGFREVYPPRVVHNLYLDTPGRRHYHEHINGLSHRVKIRLRWYGSPREAAGPLVLEFKIRHGLLGHKEAYALPDPMPQGPLAWPVLQTALANVALPGTARVQLHDLEPAVLNRYRRHYYCSADASVRLTVDSELEFLPVRNSSLPARAVAHAGLPAILELKYLEAHAADAARVANALPFRLTRCSKYVLGIEAVEGR